MGGERQHQGDAEGDDAPLAEPVEALVELFRLFLSQGQALSVNGARCLHRGHVISEDCCHRQERLRGVLDRSSLGPRSYCPAIVSTAWVSPSPKRLRARSVSEGQDKIPRL